MSDRLTFQATLVLVAAALGLAFGVQVLVGAGGSTAKVTVARAPALVQSRPGLGPALTAAWAIPPLRASRDRGLPAARSAGIARRSVTQAVSLVSVTVSPRRSASPTPTAVPRAVASPPPGVVRTPNPKPAPTPASTPQGSGDFDTSGDSATTDEPAPDVADQIAQPNQNSGEAAR